MRVYIGGCGSWNWQTKRFLAGSHIKSEPAGLSLKPKWGWLAKSWCKEFSFKWRYAPFHSLHLCTYWKHEERQVQLSMIFVRQLCTVSKHTYTVRSKVLLEENEAPHLRCCSFSVFRTQEATKSTNLLKRRGIKMNDDVPLQPCYQNWNCPTLPRQPLCPLTQGCLPPLWGNEDTPTPQGAPRPNPFPQPRRLKGRGGTQRRQTHTWNNFPRPPRGLPVCLPSRLTHHPARWGSCPRASRHRLRAGRDPSPPRHRERGPPGPIPSPSDRARTEGAAVPQDTPPPQAERVNPAPPGR